VHPLASQPIEGFAWPDGARAAAWLCWHVDAEAGVLASGKANDTAFASFSEARYGVTTALPRILRLCRDLEVPASFAFPGYVAEQHPDAVLACVEAGHEILHHGYLHEDVSKLSPAQEEDILARSCDVLERLTGQRPLGWTAPSWGVNPGTIDLLHRHGFLYDNSLMEHDVPTVFPFPDRPLFELPISTVLDDWQQFGVDLSAGDIRMSSVEHAFSLWRDELAGLAWYGGLFSPTFHPNLVGRPATLRALHALVEEFREGHGIWWTNGIRIAQHCLQLVTGHGGKEGAPA
jgi:peptidoglycan/xylan/chitin deacetylase (PgdA/CDA1 family)